MCFRVETVLMHVVQTQNVSKTVLKDRPSFVVSLES